MTKTNTDDSVQKRDFWKLFVPALVLAAVGFGVAFFFMKPAPPRQIVIAAGSQSTARTSAPSARNRATWPPRPVVQSNTR